MTETEALALLESLGDTPTKIANSLRGQGIKGRVSSARHCPINNLLLKNGAHVGTATVIQNAYLQLRDVPYDQRNDDRVTVKLPGAVRAFVVNFDNLVYPDLQTEASHE
jgi:hypothetical protein